MIRTVAQWHKCDDSRPMRIQISSNIRTNGVCIEIILNEHKEPYTDEHKEHTYIYEFRSDRISEIKSNTYALDKITFGHQLNQRL